MRILHITDRIHPGAGIAQLILTYNHFVDRDKIQFDYMAESCDEKLRDTIHLLGGEVFIIPKLGLGKLFEFNQYFKQFFREHHYSIVHSHYYQIDVLVMLFAYKNGVSHYISHSHNPRYSDYFFRSIRNWALAYPVRYLATDFCACSQESGDFLYGKRILKIRGKQIYVIPNAINYSNFTFNMTIRNNIRKSWNAENDLIIGEVGSFRPQKNQIFLIKVLKYICDNIDENVKLCLVGDGASRDLIQQQIFKCGLEDKVIIVGYTDRAWDYYNAFDCYVLPSTYEGFGLSLVEAQVNCLRCVCSTKIPDNPIISRHVNKINLSNDIEVWAEAICKSAKKGRFTDGYTDKYNIIVQSVNLENYYCNMNY